MSIPSYEDEAVVPVSSPSKSFGSASLDVVDAMLTAAPRSISPAEYTCTLPISTPSTNICAATVIDPIESNSEDNSLSDGDRTLVDSTGGPDVGDLSSTNNSPACSDTQLSSPEYHTRRITDFDQEEDAETIHVTASISKARKYYFKATYFTEPLVPGSASGSGASSSVVLSSTAPSLMVSSTTSEDSNSSATTNGTTNGGGGNVLTKPQRMLKVLVDHGMNMGTLKRNLETFVRVPKEYFKIFRMSGTTETECTRLTETLNIFK